MQQEDKGMEEKEPGRNAEEVVDRTEGHRADGPSPNVADLFRTVCHPTREVQNWEMNTSSTFLANPFLRFFVEGCQSERTAPCAGHPKRLRRS